MASRPRAGRGTTGRDSSKDVDVEADLFARVVEGLKKAHEQHARSYEIGEEIMALEEEMKSGGGKYCCSIFLVTSTSSLLASLFIRGFPLLNLQTEAGKFLPFDSS